MGQSPANAWCGVNSAGQQHLIFREDWQLSARGEVWERLRVRSGNQDVTSNEARVFVDCH
jgi:hypothetical protein